MEPVATQDKTFTFYNEKYQEHYHHPFGAATEAIKKFVEPSLPHIKDKQKIVVYDVCFGLGYNAAALLDAIAGTDKTVLVYGFEIDEEVLGQLKQLETPFQSFHKILEAIEKGEYKDKNVTIKMVIGDVRSTLKGIEKADVVFHDPFSVSKCPELWTPEFFALLYKNMNKGGMLTTYSCARKVRDAMRSAGFIVSDGPIVGRRGPATVAVKE